MPRNGKRRAETLEGTDASADLTGLQASALEYTCWLKSRGVVWSERRVLTTTEGVVAGWGCVATAPIKRGEELFRVPRAACLGAVAADADADTVDNEKDSQQRMALILGEAAVSDDWAPFVRKLTPAPCPWLYSDATQRRLYAGTELEAVLAMKRKALAAEHSALPPRLAQKYPLYEYIRLCGLAASHANPWFGGCIAPFNTMLNYSAEPNVAFAPRGADAVVGTATRKIRAGEELTQEYADATSDLIYKYGFVPGLAGTAGEDGVREGGVDVPEPLEEDVVSITVSDLINSVRGVAAAGSGGAGAGGGGGDATGGGDLTDVGGDVDVGGDATGASYKSATGACGAGVAWSFDASLRDRVAALVRAGAVEPCPWDGLGDVLTLELGAEGSGTARLVGAAMVLCAAEAEWQRARAALQEVTRDACVEVRDVMRGASSGSSGSSTSGCRIAGADEGGGGAVERGQGVSNEGDGGDSRGNGDGANAVCGSDDDLAAAALIGSLAGADAALRTSLLEVAAVEGGEDGDPWPSLLAHVLQGQPGAACFPMAWAAASDAIRRRRAALEAGEAAAGLPEAGCEVLEGSRMAARLRELERVILASAEEAVGNGVLA